MKRILIAIALSFAIVSPALSETETISGLITPRDDNGMYLMNLDGQHEIDWNDDTVVALDVNTRQFSGLKDNELQFKVHSSKQTLVFPIPPGPVTGIVTKRGGRQVLESLKVAAKETWIEERGLALYFNQAPKTQQLASEDDPRYIGLWNGPAKPRTLTINGTAYGVDLRKGGQTNALLYNLLSTKDCKPFVNEATVIGTRVGERLLAKEIHLQPIGDQTANDDPALPRYLFIGDSISGNYDRGLRETLNGKFNLHHPPTNCGPARKGRANILNWLGAYEEKGRHWDVISFNFGHWDSGNDKASYQSDLEAVIAELKKTKATLIWVTTCPVPAGNEAAGELKPKGKAPGRKSGVMKQYINPWAAEVIARHPEISTCDQWQFVKDKADTIYKDWWPGTNVHFGGEPAAALGKLLGEHVLEQTKADAFVSLFDGKSLKGWDGKPGSWEVRDGEIWCTGKTKEKNWLIWRGGEPGDFVLRMQFRWDAGNSGVQVRSDDLGDWMVFGYQVEVAQQNKMGLWHHSLLPKDNPRRKERHLMALAGETVTLAKDGSKTVKKIEDPEPVRAKFREHEWNDLEIVARGDTLVQKINGVVFSTLVDRDEKMSRKKGFIALQDHGKGCVVAFRNIRLKQEN